MEKGLYKEKTEKTKKKGKNYSTSQNLYPSHVRNLIKNCQHARQIAVQGSLQLAWCGCRNQVTSV